MTDDTKTTGTTNSGERAEDYRSSEGLRAQIYRSGTQLGRAPALGG